MAQKDQMILKFIKKIRMRIRSNVLLEQILRGTMIGIGIGILLNGAALIIPIYNAFLYSVVCVVMGVLLGAMYGIYQFPNMKKAALIGDATGLKERLTTAYERRGKGDLYSSLQKDDTLIAIRQYDIRKKLPYTISRKKLGIFTILLLSFAILAYLPSDTKELAKNNHKIKQEAKKEEKKIDEIKKELENNKELTSEKLAELNKKLNQAKKELNKSKSKEDLAKTKERLLKKLEQTIQNEKNKDAVKSLAKLGMKLDQPDLQKLKDALVQKNKEGLLSKEELEKLQQIASDMEKKAAENEAGSQEASLAKGEHSTADGSGSSSPSNGANNGSSENESGSGSASKPGSGNKPGGSGAGTGSGSGSGSGSGAGSGNGSGSGSGTGSGWNYGSDIGNEDEGSAGKNGDMVSIPNGTGGDKNLTGDAKEEGESFTQQSNQAIAWSGNQVDYNQVLSDYTNNAYSKINHSNYPAGVQDIVKSYFDQLNQ